MTITDETRNEVLGTGKNKDTFNGTKKDDYAESTTADENFKLGAGDDVIYFDAEAGFGNDTVTLTKKENLDLDIKNATDISYEIKGKDVVVKAEQGEKESSITIKNFVSKDSGAKLTVNGKDVFAEDVYFNTKYNNKNKLTGTRLNDIIDVSSYTGGKKGAGVTVNAGAGNDRITGSKFNDNITGGAGHNIINFDANKSFGNDTINLTKGEILDLNITNIDSSKLSYEINKKDVVVKADGIEGSIILKNLASKDLGATVNVGDVTLNSYVFDVAYDAKKTSFTGTWLSENIDVSAYAGGKKGAGVTINAGAGNDIITDSKFNDKIVAGAGNDVINLSGGNDAVTAGAGKNTVNVDVFEGFGTKTFNLTKGEDLTVNLGKYLVDGEAQAFEYETISDGKNFIVNIYAQTESEEEVPPLGTLKFANYVSKDVLGAGSVKIVAGDTIFDLSNSQVTVGEKTVDTKVLYFDEDSVKKGKITGTRLNDFVDASEHVDAKGKGVTINAAAGNDTIVGSRYNDTITGGAGVNTLVLGLADTIVETKEDGTTNETDVLLANGNDTYVLTKGETLQLGLTENYKFEDLTFTKSGNNLVVTLPDKNGSVTLKNYFKTNATVLVGDYTMNDDSDAYIEEKFGDNVKVNLAEYLADKGSVEIKAATKGGALSDSAYNDIITGSDKADKITVTAGHDVITAGEGNDTITIKGGSQEIVIDAKDGNDTIVGANKSDRLDLTINGVEGTELECTRSGNNLVITRVSDITDDKTSYSTTTVKDYFKTGGELYINGKPYGGVVDFSTAQHDAITYTRDGEDLVISTGDITKTLYGHFSANNLKDNQDVKVKALDADGNIVEKSVIDAVINVNPGSYYVGYDVAEMDSEGNHQVIDAYSEKVVLSKTDEGLANVNIEGEHWLLNKTKNEDGTYSYDFAGTKVDTFAMGQSGNDIIVGTDGVDYIQGGKGDDTIYGGKGDTYILGGEGNDTIHLNGGTNIIQVFANLSQGETIYGATANDRISFVRNTADDTVNIDAGKFENLVFTKDGDDLVITSNSEDAKDLNVVIKGYYTAESKIDTIRAFNAEGKAEDFKLSSYEFAVTGSNVSYDTGLNYNYTGTEGDDTVTLGAGNDKVVEKAGVNTINLGNGNNTFEISNETESRDVTEPTVERGVTTVTSGDGDDTFKFGTGKYTANITAGEGKDTFDFSHSTFYDYWNATDKTIDEGNKVNIKDFSEDDTLVFNKAAHTNMMENFALVPFTDNSMGSFNLYYNVTVDSEGNADADFSNVTMSLDSAETFAKNGNFKTGINLVGTEGSNVLTMENIFDEEGNDITFDKDRLNAITGQVAKWLKDNDCSSVEEALKAGKTDVIKEFQYVTKTVRNIVTTEDDIVRDKNGDVLNDEETGEPYPVKITGAKGVDEYNINELVEDSFVTITDNAGNDTYNYNINSQDYSFVRITDESGDDVYNVNSSLKLESEDAPTSGIEIIDFAGDDIYNIKSTDTDFYVMDHSGNDIIKINANAADMNIFFDIDLETSSDEEDVEGDGVELPSMGGQEPNPMDRGIGITVTVNGYTGLNTFVTDFEGNNTTKTFRTTDGHEYTFTQESVRAITESVAGWLAANGYEGTYAVGKDTEDFTTMMSMFKGEYNTPVEQQPMDV